MKFFGSYLRGSHQYILDDSLENYNKKNDKFKELWNSVDIRYDFNEYGFRGNWTVDSVENMGDYLLVAGDNFTFGLGLPVEMTWPHLLGLKLNLPVINLAVIDSTIENQLYNLIEFENIKNRPKYTVWQFSSLNRFFLMTAEEMFNLDHYSAKGLEDMKFSETIVDVMSNELFQKDRIFKTLQTSKLLHPNPYIWRSFRDEPIDYTDTNIPMINPVEENFNEYWDIMARARDGQHWGESAHKMFAERILENFNF